MGGLGGHYFARAFCALHTFTLAPRYIPRYNPDMLSSQVMTVKIIIGIALPEQKKWIGKAKEVLEYREVCPTLHRFRGQ